MTRTLGQVAYEARWFFKRNLRLWAHEKHDTQRRYEEAAQAVLVANTASCEHAHSIIFQLHTPEEPEVCLRWCHACGAHRLAQGAWILPRRLDARHARLALDAPQALSLRPLRPPARTALLVLPVLEVWEVAGGEAGVAKPGEIPMSPFDFDDFCRRTWGPCFACTTTTRPRKLVTVGYWTRKSSRGAPGNPIDRPMCEQCAEDTAPRTSVVTRTVPCIMCRAAVTLGSANTPDPECPEMLHLPPGACIGVVGDPVRGTIIVTCGPACLDKLMAQGLFQ